MKRHFLYFMLMFLMFAPGGAQEPLPEIKPKPRPPIKQGYRQTMAIMKALHTAVMDYTAENKAVPKANSLEELMDQDVGNGISFKDFFLDEAPAELVTVLDAWDTPLLYRHRGKRFYIASAGSDDAFEGFDQKGIYTFNKKELKGKDIIIVNEGFVLFPLEAGTRDNFRIFFRYLTAWMSIDLSFLI